VSLIETALEKLRRVGEPGAQSSVARPRTVVSSTAAIKPPAAVPPSPREYVHKRVTLDPATLRRAGYLPEEGLERRFADHYRQIKRPLIDKAFSGDSEMRLIVISSALPGDGKTFTSFNLALSIARERNMSALLVDADAPRARISNILGIRGERGLIDALVDESLDVESLIVQTDVAGLEVLPAGKLVESAPELISSARMKQVAGRLSARNPRQLVIIDSPPLLVSSEARALLRIPGQVVIVVRVNSTPRQAVLEAITHVDRNRLQGLILNHVTFTTAGGYYGYAHYGETAEK
jgi:protein-tyrosine kinase